MTFLALSPLQTALLALITTSIIVGLYLLKLRHRRVLISSSILWRRVLDERQMHSLWEKLRRIISIIVAATIALLIAMSLARPEIESLTGKNERVVIVLDTSPTMNAHTSDGTTRWQHAIERAKSLLDSGGPRSADVRLNSLQQRLDTLQKLSPAAMRPELLAERAPATVDLMVSGVAGAWLLALLFAVPPIASRMPSLAAVFSEYVRAYVHAHKGSAAVVSPR